MALRSSSKRSASSSNSPAIQHSPTAASSRPSAVGGSGAARTCKLLAAPLRFFAFSLDRVQIIRARAKRRRSPSRLVPHPGRLFAATLNPWPPRHAARRADADTDGRWRGARFWPMSGNARPYRDSAPRGTGLRVAWSSPLGSWLHRRAPVQLGVVTNARRKRIREHLAGDAHRGRCYEHLFARIVQTLLRLIIDLLTRLEQQHPARPRQSCPLSRPKSPLTRFANAHHVHRAKHWDHVSNRRHR